MMLMGLIALGAEHRDRNQDGDGSWPSRQSVGLDTRLTDARALNLEQARRGTLRLLGSEMPSTPAGGGTGAQADAAQEREKIEDARARPLLPAISRSSPPRARSIPRSARQKEIERVMEILSRRKKKTRC